MNKTLSVSPTKIEWILGATYMLLELFVLPNVIVFLNDFLPNPLSEEKLNVVFFILNFGVTTLIFRSFIKMTLLHIKQGFAPIGFAAIRGFLIYWAGNILVTMLALRINPEFINVNDANIAIMVAENFLPMAVCTIFFVPVAEELLFRGVLFAGFYNRSPVLAFVISTAVFSAIHVMGYVSLYSWDTLLLCFIQYIPPSIALGWAYARSGSILSPLLMHMVINSIGVFAMR